MVADLLVGELLHSPYGGDRVEETVVADAD